MYGQFNLFTSIWVVLGVNVGKYTIHWASGIVILCWCVYSMCVNPSIYTVIVYYWKASCCPCCDYCGDLGASFCPRKSIACQNTWCRVETTGYFLNTHMYIPYMCCCNGTCGKKSNPPFPKSFSFPKRKVHFASKKIHWTKKTRLALWVVVFWARPFVGS